MPRHRFAVSGALLRDEAETRAVRPPERWRMSPQARRRRAPRFYGVDGLRPRAVAAGTGQRGSLPVRSGCAGCVPGLSAAGRRLTATAWPARAAATRPSP